MNRFRKVKKSIYDYLTDSSVYIKDRSFALFSTCEIIAMIASLIVGIFLHEPPVSTVVTVIIILFCTVMLALTMRFNKIKTAKTVVALFLVLIIQPLMFFSKGGIYCGGPLTMLLGTYYLVLVLDGRFRIVMCAMDVIVLGVCWITGFLRPELVTGYSREADFIYSFAKFIIAFAILTALITFQSMIYQLEARKSEEKTKEVEEMIRSQNRFFSSMSHEIRTPINTVLGMNEIILRQEDATEEIRKDAKYIQGAGRLLLALINDILDISKIEAGKMDIVPVDYNVGSLASEIVNMIWLKAEEKGLEFKVDIDPSVPEILFGDEVRIRQILINLLNNAVKYTHEGSVSLHIECEPADEGKVLLKISVSDTGMGIKQEALPHLFDSFQRQDEEKNRHIEGTGLGLSIVKQLVELMDGDISVNSVYTQGSTFTVSLRQGVSSEKTIGDLDIRNFGRSVEAEKFEHTFRAPDARILIVDDNEMNLEVEKKLLDGTDIVIDLATGGEDALSLTLREKYDVIFMDHLMPVMDGIETLEKIRTQTGGLNADVPVIVLTANAGGENIELYNNSGFDGYLLKPVSGLQLEEMLKKHIDPEKMILTESGDRSANRLNTASGYARKKPVIIATSTMADIPASVATDRQISIIPYTVDTKYGVFRDGVDADSDELLKYMEDDAKSVTSDPPTVDELILFFSGLLKQAHQVIYITLTEGSSREYGWAMEAAKSFENVTVFDSGMISGATGLMALIASKLASQNVPVEKIIQDLEAARSRIHCSFMISSTDHMSRRGQISPFMNSVLKGLWMKPALKIKNGKLGVDRFLIGNEAACIKRYIKDALDSRERPDKDILLVIYAGVDEQYLLRIREDIEKRFKFDHIVFEKTSAGIASNCGPGTFGFMFFKRAEFSYNLGGMFAKEEVTDDTEPEVDFAQEEDTAAEEQAESFEPEATEPEEKEPPKEKEWYETIPQIDAASALKNCGSKESFLSVLKLFVDSKPSKESEINGFFDEKNWSDYTIKVHALKSSLRLAGALELSKFAEELEMAGKEGRYDLIMEKHGALMEGYDLLYNKVKEGLEGPGDAAKGGEKPVADDTIMQSVYEMIREGAEDYDNDRIEDAFSQMEEYAVPESEKELFEGLKEKYLSFDYEGMTELIDSRK